MAVYSVLGPGGYPRPPYNTALFGTKVPTVPSRVYTQTFSVLGPGGYPRPPYGSFAGKVAAVTPPAPTTGPTPGGRISGGYFSRGRWHALKEAWRTEDEARERARDAKRRKEREALDRAAFEAAKARAAVEASETEHEGELVRLYTALSAATGAETVAQAITKANEAVRIARAIQADIEEEEEAIAILMLH